MMRFKTERDRKLTFESSLSFQTTNKRLIWKVLFEVTKL